MARPTPAAIAAIRAEVADWSPADAELAAGLNAATIPNPEPQGAVPRPLTIMGLMQKLAPEEVSAVQDQVWVVDFRDKAAAGDREAVKNWSQVALVTGKVSPESYAAVVADVDATMPDPDWNPLVSWALLNLGRPADADDIRQARPE